MNKKQDVIFEKMAKTYADNLGQNLKEELRNTHINLDTTVLDEKVSKEVARVKRKSKIISIRKYAKIIIPAVASLLLIFIFTRGGDTSLDSDKLAMEQSDSTQSSEPIQGEFIPLSYPLPPNLSVVNQELDNGMTIYQLEDTYNDDVVMQLAYVEAIDYDVEGMQKIIVNGESVYATIEDSYQKITFEKDGIVYILTCKYDINTLLPISENIL